MCVGEAQCTASSSSSQSGSAEELVTGLKPVDLSALVATLKDENPLLLVKNQQLEDHLRKLQSAGFEASIVDDDMFAYYTGLPSKNVSEAFLELISPHLGHLHSESGKLCSPDI